MRGTEASRELLRRVIGQTQGGEGGGGGSGLTGGGRRWRRNDWWRNDWWRNPIGGGGERRVKGQLRATDEGARRALLAQIDAEVRGVGDAEVDILVTITPRRR